MTEHINLTIKDKLESSSIYMATIESG